MATDYTISFTARDDGLQSMLGGINGMFQRSAAAVATMNSELKRGSDALQGLASQALAALGMYALGGMVNKAIEAREGMAKLSQVLRSTGQASAEYSAFLKKLVEDLSALLGVDDDVIVSVLRLLISFGASREQIGKLIELTFDLASAMGTSATGAAELLGRALAGETVQMRGMRLEIDATLPKAEQIAQAIDQLSKRVGGQARAAFAEGAPAVKLFAVQLDELQKAIGEIVLPNLLLPFLEKLNVGIQKVRERLQAFNQEWSTAAWVMKESASGFGMLLAAVLGVGLVLASTAVAIAAMTATWHQLTPVLALARLGMVAILGLDLVPMWAAVASFAQLKIAVAATGWAFVAALPAIAAVVVAVASITAVVYAAAEAWRWYRARQEEAASAARVGEMANSLTAALRKEIQARLEIGKLTQEQSKAMLDAIAASEKLAANDPIRVNNLHRITMELTDQTAAEQKLVPVGEKIVEITQAEALAWINVRIQAQEYMNVVEGAKDKTSDAIAIAAQVKDDAKYKQGLLSLDEYFVARKQRIMEASQREYDAVENQATLVDLQISKIDKKGVSDSNAIDRNKLVAEREILNEQLKALEFKDQAEITRIDVEAEADRLAKTKELREMKSTMATEGWDTGAPGQAGFNAQQAMLNAERTAQEQLYQDRIQTLKKMGLAEDAYRGAATQAWTAYQRKLTTLEHQEAAAKLQVQMGYLQATSGMLGNMASAAQAFGRKGFAMYKAFATAQAVVNTASAAIGAYNSMVGIPYVGPILAAIALAAAIAAGAAQIAIINSASPPSYAQGGLIQGGQQTVQVNERGPEFIIPAERVRQVGLPFLESIRSGPVPQVYDSAQGGGTSRGSAGSGRGQSGPINVSFGQLNDRNAMRQFMAGEGAKIVISQLNRRSNKISL